ncbi:unnamed protein product [Parajaminaea phylloscopi]
MVKLTSLAPLAGLLILSLSLGLATSAHPAPAVADHNAQLKRHTFVTEVPTAFASSTRQQPKDVAMALARSLLTHGSDSSLSIRDDSYLDAAHGVWHVYIAQHIHGLKVFNAGLQVAVTEDGRVLSYSHNLYDGNAPSEPTQGGPVSECQLDQSAIRRRDLHQMVFSSGTTGHRLLDAKSALVGFLAQAVSAQGKKLGPVDLSPETSFADIPFTTGDVDASMAYVIAANGCLVLTHRFEIPMQDNSYEAYVDAFDGSIRAVADWTSPGMAGARSLGRPDFSNIKVGSSEDEDLAIFEAMSEDMTTVFENKVESAEESLPPSYKVFEWKVNDPSEAKRTYQYARHDPEVSPFGWHAHPSERTPFKPANDKNVINDGNLTKYTDTRGNNVFVSWGGVAYQDAWDPDMPRPRGAVINGSRTFDYPYPWRKYDKEHKELDPRTYALASQTQLFYTINEYHDLTSHYGFDGASGNFEEYKTNGVGGDAIVAFAQSKAGRNNADFSTPPVPSRGSGSGRGGSGGGGSGGGGISRRATMRMYSWDGHPQRDGSFEAGIVLHEFTHGVSTRLTGGPSDSSCLGWGESGGMGEGWGDTMATLARDRNGTTLAFTMGAWASGRPGGIRHWPYSRNITISPETYETLNKPGYWAVHAAGEVWATILLDVVEHAKTDYGFSPTLFPPATTASKEEKAKFYLTEEEIAKLPNGSKRSSKRPIPRHGNTLLTQLIIDGMKLQPCRPDFLQARDAIVKAAEILTGGDDDVMCLLRHAFAKRGLGLDAKVTGQTPWGGGIHTNGHKKPSVCKNTRHV